jgi:hypothetical protein
MFYTFNQNNSGGVFDVDERVAHYVIVEANSAEEANKIAETKGIYFDGVSKGHDCACCGDRWYAQWEDKGDQEPLIYGEKPEKFKKDPFTDPGEPYCHVYLLEGQQLSLRKPRHRAGNR